MEINKMKKYIFEGYKVFQIIRLFKSDEKLKEHLEKNWHEDIVQIKFIPLFWPTITIITKRR
jgi:hypothetical protein